MTVIRQNVFRHERVIVIGGSSDLNISLAGGQPLIWINHKRKVQVIYPPND